jgi:hypothetical protein
MMTLDYIINPFFLQNKNSSLDFYNYIKKKYEKKMSTNDVKKMSRFFIKKNIILLENGEYMLTNKGKEILSDYKKYYSRIIRNFFLCIKYKNRYKFPKKSTNEVKIRINDNEILHDKQFGIKEIRPEQQSLRIFLIKNKKHSCILCDKNLPIFLLETAHLKSRNILNCNELLDRNNVEFMCRYCHRLYDNGFLAVYNGLLYVSPEITGYDITYENSKIIPSYNSTNKDFFNYHYENVFRPIIHS